MVRFTFKKISPQTLGEIFKKNREEAGLTLEQVAEAIQVNKACLKLLEQGDYGEILNGFYAKRILKNYADYLNLEFAPLWKLYLKEQTIQKKNNPSNFVKVTPRHKLIDISKIIKICLYSLIAVLFLSYLGWEVRKIFLPPYLEIISPVDNLIIPRSVVEVIGKTEKETIVSINGQEISTDKEGFFSESVNLKNGLNVIKISSKKEHSRENIIYRRVVVTESKSN